MIRKFIAGFMALGAVAIAPMSMAQTNTSGLPMNGTVTGPSGQDFFAGGANVMQTRKDGVHGIFESQGVAKFGPVGTSDDTATFQAAVNNAPSVYVPAGSYHVCGVILPFKQFFTIYGDGRSSKIFPTQSCNKGMFSWNFADNTAMDWSQESIRGIYVNSVGLSGPAINTTGEGGVEIAENYFDGSPKLSDIIYVNGTSVDRQHDVIIRNNHFFGNTSDESNSYVHFGQYTSDSYLRFNIASGNFGSNYGLQIDSGANELGIEGNHFYNFSKNDLYIGGCQDCSFHNNVWDNSLGGDIAYAYGLNNSVMIGDELEAMTKGGGGLTLVNSHGNIFKGIQGSGSNVADHLISDDAASSFNFVDGVAVGTLSQYTTPIKLMGNHSYAENVTGIYGRGYSLFTGNTGQAIQAGTYYLGAAGANSDGSLTRWVASNAAYIQQATVVITTAPTIAPITITLNIGGSDKESCQIPVGQYGCTINASDYATQNASLALKFNSPTGNPQTGISYSVNAQNSF